MTSELFLVEISDWNWKKVNEKNVTVYAFDRLIK
jgi:hypothetical protein